MIDMFVVTVAPGFSGGIPNSLITVVLMAMKICYLGVCKKVAYVSAVNSHFDVGTRLPRTTIPTLS